MFAKYFAAVLLTAGVAGQAAAQEEGRAEMTLASLFSVAHPVRLSGGQRAMELKDVDYGGVRWRKVDFVFGPGGRLSRLTLTTSAADYQDILSLASGTDPETLIDVGMIGPSPFEEMQARVCEDDGEVSLTFEQASAQI